MNTKQLEKLLANQRFRAENAGYIEAIREMLHYLHNERHDLMEEADYDSAFLLDYLCKALYLMWDEAIESMHEFNEREDDEDDI